MILKDDIAMHTCVDGLFLRCILQSRRIKQTQVELFGFINESDNRLNIFQNHILLNHIFPKSYKKLFCLSIVSK